MIIPQASRGMNGRRIRRQAVGSRTVRPMWIDASRARFIWASLYARGSTVTAESSRRRLQPCPAPELSWFGQLLPFMKRSGSRPDHTGSRQISQLGISLVRQRAKFEERSGFRKTLIIAAQRSVLTNAEREIGPEFDDPETLAVPMQ